MNILLYRLYYVVFPTNSGFNRFLFLVGRRIFIMSNEFSDSGTEVTIQPIDNKEVPDL